MKESNLSCLVGIILALIFSFIFLLLWNWLMPDIFKLPEINYIQALGLYVLSNLVFKKTDIDK